MFFKILWVFVVTHILMTWLLALRKGYLARISSRNELTPPVGEQPGVSIIVPAWNESGTIERNIHALRQVVYPNWEALIVAGGEDGTYQAAIQAAAGDARFRILARGPEPKNAALKKGIQVARHDTLVLLDADNIVKPGWLAGLMVPISNGATVCVGHSFPNRLTWVTLEERMWHIYTYQILKLSWIQGDRSIAIRRDLLEKIGGLPEHTYAREDWDIWARLEPLGVKVAFAADARLVTDRPATLKEHWRHQVRWRRTHLSGMWEHRAILLKKPADLFRQLYGYLQSVVITGLVLGTLLSTFFFPGLSPVLWNLLGLTITWLCLRQAAVAFSVAAYTGDWLWAARAWMPAVNMLVLIPASIFALMTPDRMNPYYKGPRHSV